MADWTRIEAYAGPLRYSQIELFKMMGYSIDWVLGNYP